MIDDHLPLEFPLSRRKRQALIERSIALDPAFLNEDRNASHLRAPAFFTGVFVAHARAADAPRTEQALPTDPGVPVPAPDYSSAFSDYRAYREPEIADWRAVNDEVARIGGHIGIFRSGGFGPGESTGSRPAGEAQPAGPGHGH
jgi:hypothetical protein